MNIMPQLARPARIISSTVVAAAVAGSFMLPVAPTAEAQDAAAAAAAAAAASIPGSPQLPDTDQLTEQAKDAALKHPLVNNALKNQSSTPEPDNEESTNPECAPIVLVAVPGTFETNRDHNPNEPVGTLSELTEPARAAMGGQLSETYINYAADAGVSGTAYAKSIQNGATKTLKTIEDVQNRCDGSRVFLTGFSQGADVAGDVATMIGQKQTNIRPETMAGVVLFSDPSRTENTNHIAGTSQPVPHLPSTSGKESEGEDDGASLGQRLNDLLTSGVAESLMNGSLAEDKSKSTEETQAPATTTPAQAGDESKPTESVENNALDGNQVKRTGGISLSEDNVSILAAGEGTMIVAADEEEAEGQEEVQESAVSVQNTVSDLYRDGKCGSLTFLDCYGEYLDNPEKIETKADVVRVPENLPPGNLIETSCVNSRVDACKFADPQESLPQVPTQQVAADNQSLNDGANPALRSDDGADAAESKGSDTSGEPTDEAPGDSGVPGADIDGVDDAEPGSAATSGDRAPAPRGSTGTPTEIGGDSGVGESTGSDRASTGAGSPTGATGGGASDARATSPSTGETSQRGNTGETSQRGNMGDSRTGTDAGAGKEKEEAPSTQRGYSAGGAGAPQAGDAPDEDNANNSTGSRAPQAGDSSGQTSNNPGAGRVEKSQSEDRDSADSTQESGRNYGAGAGDTSKPKDSNDSAVSAGEAAKPTTGDSRSQAGEENKPTESSQPSQRSEPTTTQRSDRDQAGGQSREQAESQSQRGGGSSNLVGRGEPLEELEPITMAAVAGGGVAGQRDEDFGQLKGAVVSMCVPGDIVCSLPENSQLARDLVAVGEKVTTNLSGVAKAALAGDTRMGGLMAVEATSLVFDLSGLPPLKLSGDSIMALVALVSGAAMIHAGDPTGQGAALIAATIPKLPQVLPELYEQIKDIPAIIEALPDAADNFAHNLGLDQILDRLSEGYKAAGINDLTDLVTMPTAAIGASIDLLNDNSGLMEMATNPDYLKAGAHSTQGFRGTIITEDGTNAGDWYGEYLSAVGTRVHA